MTAWREGTRADGSIMPLPAREAAAWLAGVREQLGDYPLDVPGPYGDPVHVSHQGGGSVTRYVVLLGHVERADRQMIPIELEVAPGVVVALADARVYYKD